MFREAENHDAVCSYHTGHLWDYDKYAQLGLGLPGDIWQCCGRIIEVEGETGKGCAVGRHIEAAPDGPGPIKRDLEAAERRRSEISAQFSIYRLYPSRANPERIEFARWRVRRFLAGRLTDLEYETARAPEDAAILEHHCLDWMLECAANARYTLGRRHLIAALAVDPGNRDRLQRAANQGAA